MYDQFDAIDHLKSTLFQCKLCRYNTFDSVYIAAHVRGHKIPQSTQVMESEEQPPETKKPEAGEPPRKAPARRRRAKKEL